VRVLLDSHVLLWWIRDDRRLSRVVRRALLNPRNQVAVSAASLYELSFKRNLGKLTFDTDEIETILRQDRIAELAISPKVALRAGELGLGNRDPWDRIIAAHSIVEDWIVATGDEKIAAFGAKTLW
jgi:PIN domain nuclease of toxin-antitoxin system